MPKPGWGAIVIGQERDLAIWKHELKEPFDPWVEKNNDETILRSQSFDNLSSADEVRNSAVALIEWLNGATALAQQAKPVRFNGVIQISADGKVHRTLFAEAVAEAFAEAVARHR